MANFSMTGSPEKHYPIEDFSGGLNNKYSQNSLATNEATDLLNMVIDARGNIYKRPGLSIATDYVIKDGVEILQTEYFIRRDGTRETFVFYKDGTIKGKNLSGTYDLILKKVIATDPDIVTEVIPAHSNRNFSSFIFDDIYYFGNKIDGWFSYTDGEEAILVDTIPKADFALIRNGRAYYAGLDEQPDRMYYSHVGYVEDVTLIVRTDIDEDQVNVGGMFDFPTTELPITGISDFEGGVLVFKRDGVFFLTGDDIEDYAVKKLSVATGCVSPRSITTGTNVVYFLGYDGLYYIFTPSENVYQANLLSDKITPEFKSISKEITHGFFFKTKLYLFCGTKTLIFDETTKAWTKYDWKINSAMYDEELDEVVLGGKCGYLYTPVKGLLRDELEPDVYTPIEAHYCTPYMHMGTPQFQKRFKFIKLFYKPNTIPTSVINMSVSLDYVEQPVKQIVSYEDTLIWEDDGDPIEENDWGEKWGDPIDQVSKRISFGGTGEYIKVKFSNDALDEDLGINIVIFGYKEKNKVR